MNQGGSRLETVASFFKIKAVLFYFFFWPYHAACGILVPRSGIKPVLPAVEVQSLNHWTAREVPGSSVLNRVGF